MEEQMRALEDKLGAQEALIEELRSAPVPAPERIEVPVVPAEVNDTFAELAARTEAMAAALEDRLGVSA